MICPELAHSLEDFFLRPSTLTTSNFKALFSTGLIFRKLKDLNLFKKCTKNKAVSYNFRLNYVLSNRPHFNSAHLVIVGGVLSMFVEQDPVLYSIQSRIFFLHYELSNEVQYGLVTQEVSKIQKV